jgi:hypothetical protein
MHDALIFSITQKRMQTAFSPSIRATSCESGPVARVVIVPR